MKAVDDKPAKSSEKPIIVKSVSIMGMKIGAGRYTPIMLPSVERA